MHNAVEDKNAELMEACKIGDIEAINKYIEAGADVNFEAPYSGYTPLIKALKNNQLEAAKLLYRRGALIEFPSSIFLGRQISVFEAARDGGCIVKFAEFVVEENSTLKRAVITI